ncbi:MAG: amidophosphoribosyltransferase, partial [Sulfurimicrobium sp.]|nr:amidophosphoribosyltransferase [Sulfurimicrobium sp.]
DIEALVEDVRAARPDITLFDTSCFNGEYITGDISPEYLAEIESSRGRPKVNAAGLSSRQLDLNLNEEDDGS